MTSPYYGPVLVYQENLVIGDPDEHHLVLSPEVLTYRQRHYAWRDVADLKLETRVAPAIVSKGIEYAHTVLAAIGLDLGHPTATALCHLRVSSNQESFLITAKGRKFFTRREIATINTFLTWLITGNQNTLALNQPAQVIDNLRRSARLGGQAED